MNLKQIAFPAKLFITGIDTDAGKSFATGWLAREIMEQGESVITQKFVQTGNLDFSEDIEVHRKIMGIPLTTVDKLKITAPVIFTYPASPDLAARIDGKELDLTLIEDATSTLSKTYQHVLIEGAGGIMVPLKGEYLTIDYIRDHQLPVALVTNGRLGSINHTLLTLKAIADEGIELFAVLYNTYFDKDQIICKDTKEYINNWLSSHFPQAIYLEF
ncbi:MAG: dethiobiotin synthase [Muribaculaceae bacterium]|nr:dethiobiotin synthase [Muribaculaceae bacterium]MDE6683369.1 dethiobiotin synthase [Muribaculaceae bacterium]